MTAGEETSRASFEVRAPLAIAAAIPVLMLWTLPWADRQLAVLPGLTGVFLARVLAAEPASGPTRTASGGCGRSGTWGLGGPAGCGDS